MAELAPSQVLAVISTLLFCTTTVTSQVLTPPYFNLAVGKQVDATATCGEGVPEKELYCKLTGANPGRGAEHEPDFQVIQGQLCDYCQPGIPNQAHPAENVLDGTERWWQSPPLSRGLQFNEVNLTIDLGQEFHVAYVLIKTANSPRPGVFALERSTDYGQTWEPWQYFADTLSDCRTFFGDTYEESITRDDSVVCTTEYSSVVPLEGGEIVVSLVNERPSAYNFSYASTLQEWTRATTVRLRLLRTKTLLGHLMAIVRQDPTVTRRYFYSIKDISIGGRCVCNGHASSCDKTSQLNPYKLLCRCVHNTCGDQCERCCEGFVQKPWRPATSINKNSCEPCNCHSHSTECYYDEEVARKRQSLDIHGRYEGGGVCQNCQHNTEGTNCERCQPGYYRPENMAREAPNACQRCRCDPTYSTGECEEGTGRCKCRPEYTGVYCDQCNLGYYGYPRCTACDCNVNGTEGSVCEVGGGQCPCKPNYSGANCDRCSYGYYGFPNCQPCMCDSTGSRDQNCNPYSGECSCSLNFGGRTCGECSNGYYGYPNCQSCSCDPTGSTEEICDKIYGGCLCKPGFGGYRCDRCETGFYRYPSCMECGCQDPGTQQNDCDAYGQCICKPNYEGPTCDRCARGYYSYPDCMPCNCDRAGSHNFTCDETNGQCNCRYTFEGVQCDKCRPNFYNYPVCEECNCNPAGAKSVPGYPHGGCGSHAIPGRLCQCKDRVEGHICDTCKAGFWNLDINNVRGCEDCACYKPGTTGASSVCNTNGQCMCKPFSDGRRCDQCRDGTYNMQDYNIFGCEDCSCDIGGSSNRVCDKSSGQCACRPRVAGRQCEKPLDQHYFPTLHQHRYELEDGYTPSGGRVRYGFDNAVFQDYSWRGYAIFSRLQDEVLIDVDIQKPSLYRLVFRYVSRNIASVEAEVTITPSASDETQQKSTAIFQPAFSPTFVTVSGTGAFVLNPGRWTISLKTPESIFVDYLAVLPQGYYEGTILQQQIAKPCKVPADNEPCLHFVYVDVLSYSVTRGETGYVTRNEERDRTQTFPDQDISSELGTSNMAHLNSKQTNLQLTVPVPSPGRYIFIVQYHSADTPSVQELEVDVTTRSQSVQGRLILPGCPYSSLCRRAIADQQGDTLIVDVDGTHASMTLMGRANIDVAIDSVIAIPVNEWTVEFLQPSLKCVRMDKQCIESTFVHPTGSTPVEFESGPNQDRVETDIPPHIIDTSIKVIKVDNVAPSVNIKASVLSQGPHVVVVHYFQPHYVGFEVYVNVTVGAKLYRGKFQANYCPGVSGCRAVVNFDDADDNKRVDLNELDVSVSVNSRSGKPIWLDYIMVIPHVQYNDGVLRVMPIDRASIFLSQCGRDNFYIDPATTGFCRDSIYSLTTAYNNGGIQCSCNTDGSTSLMCQEFGGQCTCKQNVIGRTCAECRTGFYGFPNCRPCGCPSGLCDPRSGQCVCPPRVTGASCNICLPRTFGFHPLIGCEDCNCDPNGVVNNNLECDVDIGQCECKPNVDGRSCDRCLNGHYNFPRCDECDCDARGTTGEICDQRDATCMCKKNMQGRMCDQCKAGTFYPEERNPDGCTECFCFGTTTICSMATYLRRTQVRDMRGWGVSNLRSPTQRPDGRGISVDVNRNGKIEASQPLYWIAPAAYLGNKITSYGGKLTYTIRFTRVDDLESMGTVHDDVIIEGNNMTLTHLAVRQPIPGEALTVELDLLEIQFRHKLTGALVTRKQMMTVLSNIRSLQIRASYNSHTDSVSLLDIYMDMADATGTGAVASNVEMCTCPPNYSGTSCEECAPGYYRLKTGPYLGVCVQCECNGRSSTCNPDTGECYNCNDNFGGPQCLSCRQGYYRDDYTNRCEICACPMAIASNNFASTCEVSNGVVFRCICLPGYIGSRCDTCDIGYYGNPLDLGGRCEQCECNGNIDLRDPRSCDPTSGECLQCIHDTMGRRCERCRDWYYGDALVDKNCQMCTCDRLGTEQCEHNTGLCTCKPNVLGVDCDHCAPGTYGFTTGTGCAMCNCGAGAVRSECDETTGQCECQPGVTGRQCDRCMEGFWDYTPLGCRSCECKVDGATTCDPINGKCQCLPGVTGDRCDRCMDRWVLIAGEGCRECDSCVSLLIDDVEVLDRNVSNIMRDLDSVSVGVTAMRRLERINTTVHNLRPLVDSLTPNKNPLDPLMQEMNKMKEMAKKGKESSGRALREAEVLETDAADTLKDTDDLSSFVQDGAQIAKDAVKFAQDVLEDIQSNIHNQNVERLITEAGNILKDMRDRRFDDDMIASEDEFISARETLERVKNLEDRMTDQMDRLSSLDTTVEDISDRLYDLINSSRHSSDNSRAALDVVDRGNLVNAQTQGDYSSITNLRDSTKMLVNMAQDLIQTATSNLEEARDTFDEVGQKLSEMDGAIRSLDSYIANMEEESRNVRPLVDNATAHAMKLDTEALFLDSMIADTQSSAEGALNASRAYEAIIEAINTAENASRLANVAVEQAQDQSNGVADQASVSVTQSGSLRDSATNVKTTVQDQLQIRLDSAKSNLQFQTDLHDSNEDKLSDLLVQQGKIPKGGYSERAEAAANKAMGAQQRATDAESRVKSIADRLPEDQKRSDQIPIDISNANRDIVRAKTQVDQVMGLIPKATTLIDSLTVDADRVNMLGNTLRANISELRNNIDIAREEASRIRVGLAFDPTTILQVHNPQNLEQAGSYTKLSLYVKTSEADGLLAYIGPEGNADRTTSADYYAMEIEDGKAVLKFDLGGGSARIVNPRRVDDGEWHEVIAERTGQTATVTVRTEDEESVSQSGTIEGTFSVLDFKDAMTLFFIGGADPKANLAGRITNMHYTGEIVDVMFDGVPVGLWDFASGQNNINGALQRDKLIGITTDGFRFSGDGYVILDKGRFIPETRTAISMQFKTYADNGLMFLIGDNTDFLSIELYQGKIVLQYDLGSGTGRLESKETYNDGKWHTLFASRVGRRSIVKINSIAVATGITQGTASKLETDDNVYIGGHRGPHPYKDVTNTGFDGCIKDIKLGRTLRDINKNKVAKGVLPGCPEVERTVSFPSDVESAYIAMEPLTEQVGSKFQATMKIKSHQQDGLIMYIADDTQSNSFGISLKGGKIVLSMKPVNQDNSDGKVTHLESDTSTYNDGHWHYITVTKENRDLQLDVDDTEMVKTKVPGKKRLTTTSPVYFGGLPPAYSLVEDNVPTTHRFIGCIGDVTMQGSSVNFALSSSINRPGAALSACPIPDPTPATTPPPTFETIMPHTTTTVSPGQFVTDSSRDQCVLPLEPTAVEVSADSDPTCFLFNSHPESRIEYQRSPQQPKHRYNFTLEFKTTSPDGMLFYLVDDPRQMDYIALFMLGGNVVYTFNCGTGPARMVSPRTYNDGQWHKVKIHRRYRSGTLYVDDEEVAAAKSEGASRTINASPPFYVGSLDAEKATAASYIFENNFNSFVGAIRQLKMNNNAFESPSLMYEAKTCSPSEEVGSFFFSDGGFIKLMDKFKVGLDLEVYMEIRPRSVSGVLLSVTSAGGDYLILQLINGVVRFSVDNGKGEIVTTSTPASATTLCDGNWHKIRASKAKNVVTIVVDMGGASLPGVGDDSTSTDTEDPVYVGGVPAFHKGIKTKTQYVGCIRNLRFNDASQDLTAGAPTGHVSMDTCPTS